MERITSINGPVEDVGGNLTLRIPLAAGGEELASCSRGIGVVEGDFLVVVIPAWLAEKIGVVAGSVVNVNNREGKFNIHVTDRSER